MPKEEREAQILKHLKGKAWTNRDKVAKELGIAVSTLNGYMRKLRKERKAGVTKTFNRVTRKFKTYIGT